MLYVHKKDKNDIKELLHSEPDFIIVLDKGKDIENPFGRVIKNNKKTFKRSYKKYKNKNKKVKETSPEEKKEIVNEILRDKIGILEYTEDYIEQRKLQERKKYFLEIYICDF